MITTTKNPCGFQPPERWISSQWTIAVVVMKENEYGLML